MSIATTAATPCIACIDHGEGGALCRKADFLRALLHHPEQLKRSRPLRPLAAPNIPVSSAPASSLATRLTSCPKATRFWKFILRKKRNEASGCIRYCLRNLLRRARTHMPPRRASKIGGGFERRADVEAEVARLVNREATMITGRGGMGSHKHGISGYAPRSPRYKFTQTLEANKALAARKRRPALTATTIKEALRNSKRGRP
jgi:hypothetical protein